MYPSDFEAAVDKYLGWYQSKVRSETHRLIRMIILPKIAATGKIPTLEEKQSELEHILGEDGIASEIEKVLSKTKAFLCGDIVTVADLPYTLSL